MAHRGSPKVGRKLAVSILAVGLGMAAVACSSGGGTKTVALNSTSGHTGVTVAPGTSSAPGASSTPGNTGGPGTTAPPSTTGSASPKPGTTTTAPKAGGGVTATTKPTTTVPKVTTPVSTGPAPAAVGTYRYNLVSGSSILTSGTTSTTLPVAAKSTLVVSTTGSGQQQWVNPSTTTNMAFTNAGVYLVAEAIPLVGATCTFSAPVASPPWPLAVGKSFSGQATCTENGQAGGTLSLSGRVTGTANVSVGGTSVSTFLVQSTLSIAGSSLVIAETDWYAPSLRVPVKTTVAAQGGVTGYTIASTTTYLLASTHPS